jgi:hypothetical protein
MIVDADAELASAGVLAADLIDGARHHGPELENLASTVFSRWAALIGASPTSS